MNDPTEPLRRARGAEINTAPAGRGVLEATYGRVWDTEELGREFEVVGFLAPFVVVRRKFRRPNRVVGVPAPPRFYFSFEPDRG
jgi:hypothetical protein